MPELIWKITSEADFKAAQQMAAELDDIAIKAEAAKQNLTELEKTQYELNEAIKEYAESQKPVDKQTMLDTEKKLVELHKEDLAILKEMQAAGMALPYGTGDIGGEPAAGGGDDSARYQETLAKMYQATKTAKEEAYSAEFSSMVREASEAQRIFAEETAHAADEELRLYTTLSPATQAMLKQGQEAKQTSEKVASMHAKTAAFRHALSPLLADVPVVGQAISILGSKAALSAVPILAAAGAIGYVYNKYKELTEFIDKVPDFSRPFVRSMENMRDVARQSRVEMEDFRRELMLQKSATDQAKDALDALGKVRESQMKREQSLEDKRKELEIAKTRIKVKDPIKQAEAILAIEEKFNRLRLAREDREGAGKVARMEADRAIAGQQQFASMEKVLAQKNAVEAIAKQGAKAQQLIEEQNKKTEDDKARYEASRERIMGLVKGLGDRNITTPEQFVADFREDRPRTAEERISQGWNRADVEIFERAKQTYEASRKTLENLKEKQKNIAEDLSKANRELERFESETKAAVEAVKSLTLALGPLKQAVKDEQATRHTAAQFDEIINRTNQLEAAKQQQAEDIKTRGSGQAIDEKAFRERSEFIKRTQKELAYLESRGVREGDVKTTMTTPIVPGNFLPKADKFGRAVPTPVSTPVTEPATIAPRKVPLPPLPTISNELKELIDGLTKMKEGDSAIIAQAVEAIRQLRADQAATAKRLQAR